MTLDEILYSLFPQGHDVEKNDRGLVRGSGVLAGGGRVQVLGVVDRTPIGADEALQLSEWVLDVIAQGDSDPILIVVDSDSQRMSKREELLGLNEYLAHLAKALIHADLQGHATVGLLFGHTAAGAFIATALATRTLVALPGAQPEVMDLPSMSRVTKLPIEILMEKAKSTPVFAPGLENLAQTGAVCAQWNDKRSLADQLQVLLHERRAHRDQRDALGKLRNGRPKAADIQDRVRELALQAQ
jgi:malonate decarboxylase gamma subunit